MDYEFVSVGHKGNIIKRVSFTPLARSRFNVGFGDVDMTTDEIADLAVSDNGDSRLVLVTVAAIVHDFILKNKGAEVLAIGGSASRNRLYRIGINNHWQIINPHFEIFGFCDNKWEHFEKEKSYEAFLINLRKM